MEPYFRFFKEHAQEDTNSTKLHYATTLDPDICEFEQLTQHLSSNAEECLKVAFYRIDDKLEVEGISDYIACQAASNNDFEMKPIDEKHKNNFFMRWWCFFKKFIRENVFRSYDKIKNNLKVKYTFIDFSEYNYSKKLKKLKKYKSYN